MSLHEVARDNSGQVTKTRWRKPVDDSKADAIEDEVRHDRGALIVSGGSATRKLLSSRAVRLPKGAVLRRSSSSSLSASVNSASASRSRTPDRASASRSRTPASRRSRKHARSSRSSCHGGHQEIGNSSWAFLVTENLFRCMISRPVARLTIFRSRNYGHAPVFLSVIGDKCGNGKWSNEPRA